MASVSAGSNGVRTIPVGSVLRARVSSAPVTLPLRGNWTYARFRHLQGVPGGGEDGYTLSRLRALDALIDRLAVARGSARAPGEAEVARAAADPQGIDRLIAMYQRELQAALGTELGGGHSALGGIADTGEVFSLLA